MAKQKDRVEISIPIDLKAPVTLVGSARWVMEILRSATIKVTNTKNGHPAVFLKWKDGDQEKFECLAKFAQVWSGAATFDHWPFEEDIMDDGAERDGLGVKLTIGGAKLLRAVAMKCHILLKLRIRQHDRGDAPATTNAFKLHLIPSQ